MDAVVSGAVAVPPPEQWPESLLDLARERGQQTGDADAARHEVWLSWAKWKAVPAPATAASFSIAGGARQRTPDVREVSHA